MIFDQTEKYTVSTIKASILDIYQKYSIYLNLTTALIFLNSTIVY